MSGSKDAAAAGAGVTQCVPEQNQDADRCSARQGKEGAGAEGLSAQGPAGTESKKGLDQCQDVSVSSGTDTNAVS